MRNQIVALLMIFLLALLVPACQTGEVAPVFDSTTAHAHIRTQLAFGPRIPGTREHAETLAWIEEELAAAGWQPIRQSFSYQDTLLTNLYASSDPSSEDGLIILGAHYDTRPHADRDPGQPFEPVPGANDGASGVAVLLELARVLPPGTLDFPLMLVFFDGEDSGGINNWDWIVGSTHFAAQLEQTPAGVIIVDMVADRTLSLPLERNSDPDLQASLWETGRRSGFPAFETRPGYAMIDDHTPFLARGIPAVDIIDFDYPAWHTTADTLDQVSAQSLEQVGQTLVNWLMERNTMIINTIPVR